MDQNTGVASVKKDKDAAKTAVATPFSISTYLTPTAIHVAVEIIIACVFFAYFQRKINKQKVHYDARIEALETQVAGLTAAFNELVGAKQFVAPKPQSKSPLVQQQAYAPPPPASPSPQPGMAMSFFQDFMKGSMGGGLFDRPPPPPAQVTSLTSIEEVAEDSGADEEVTRDQLDKELSEELGELKK